MGRNQKQGDIMGDNNEATEDDWFSCIVGDCTKIFGYVICKDTEEMKGKLRRMKANKIYGQHSTVLFRNDNPKIVFYFLIWFSIFWNTNSKIGF